jgi:DNA-binding HxlR family transcriptional regulator
MNEIQDPSTAYLDVSTPAIRGAAISTTSCGLGEALAVIGGKWKPAIIWELHLASLRFGALRRQVAGISEKVLYEQLRELEADGVVWRSIFEKGRVICVEYALTEAGMKLNAAVHALGEWGLEYAGGAISNRAHAGSAKTPAARPRLVVPSAPQTLPP